MVPAFEITDTAGQSRRGIANLRPNWRGQCIGGRLFDNFLMTALQRAVPFAKMHDIAEMVAQYLNFNMPRITDVALHIKGVVAKCRLRLRGCRLKNGFPSRLHSRPA